MCLIDSNKWLTESRRSLRLLLTILRTFSGRFLSKIFICAKISGEFLPLNQTDNWLIDLVPTATMASSRESFATLRPTSRFSMKWSMHTCPSPAWTSAKKTRPVLMWLWSSEDLTCKWRAISSCRLDWLRVRIRVQMQTLRQESHPSLSATIKPS